MQVPTNSYPAYPVARAPAASPQRREDDVRATEAPAAAPVPSARPAPVMAALPEAMLQAQLRGRLLDAGSSFASRQALAQYVDVAQRDESRAQVEVLGIDAYV